MVWPRKKMISVIRAIIEKTEERTAISPERRLIPVIITNKYPAPIRRRFINTSNEIYLFRDFKIVTL